MLAAVLAEQAQLTFSDISVARPLIEEKKLKALAVTTPERWPAIANLPTMIEGSVPTSSRSSGPVCRRRPGRPLTSSASSALPFTRA